jgi:hypothetical protein
MTRAYAVAVHSDEAKCRLPGMPGVFPQVRAGEFFPETQCSTKPIAAGALSQLLPAEASESHLQASGQWPFSYPVEANYCPREWPVK